MESKGFTLIELLVVIAILAILTTTVVLVLNPAELLRQARDSRRISDLQAMNHAISLYLTDQAVASTFVWNTTSTCTVSVTGNTVSSTSPIASTTGASGLVASGCWVNTTQANDGTGWIPVQFTAVTGGAPISKLPLDPVNASSTACGTACYYSYKASSTVGIYEIDAAMESIKYSSGGSNDVESKDGGNNSSEYEVGSSLVL